MLRHLTPVFALVLAFSAANAAAAEPPQSRAPAQPPAQPERVVAARVGATEVTVEDLIRFASLNPQRVRTLAAGPEGRADVLRLLIANVLLQQAMAEEGVLPTDSDPESYQRAYEQLRAKYFAESEAIPEADVRAFYDENLSLFGIPAAARISQIQFRFPENADDEAKAATKRRAEAALERLDAGEAFSTVAAEMTENDNAKESKGDLGFIERDRWSPWLSQALEGVAVGQHTGAVPSPVGYEILQVTDTRDAITAPFEDVREDVERRLRQQRELEARDAYIKRLAEKTNIVIELDGVREYFEDGVFP